MESKSAAPSKTGASFDRFLTVRGLCEREAKATLVIWPIRIASYAENLPTLKQTIEANKALVMDYLKTQGIATENVFLRTTRHFRQAGVL